MIDQTLLNDVEQIARNAGSAIMKVYAREFSVEEKEDKSPLTEADKAAHEILLAWIAMAVIGWLIHWMALKSSLSVTVNLPLILR